jgi:hypothetical protein
MLKRVYDHLAGNFLRQQHQMKIDSKKEEVTKLTLEIQSMRAANDHSNNANESSNLAPRSYKLDQRNPIEILTDEMFKAKDELLEYEEKFKFFEDQSHTIGFKDIDVVLKKLGVTMTKKTIEVCAEGRAPPLLTLDSQFMIWEVDELGDGVIDWDEFLLTYYRNIVSHVPFTPSLTNPEPTDGYLWRL